MTNTEGKTDDLTAEDRRANPTVDEKTYIVRAAVCPLRLPPSTRSMFTTPAAHRFADDLQDKMEAALRSDVRVTEVLDIGRNEHIDNAKTSTYWKIEASSAKLTDALMQFEALHFNQPILFRVRVPVKNQPTYRSMADVPADEYLVAWDGLNLLVQWEQDSARSTGSGGHVVQHIIEELSRKIGLDAQIIACAQTCHHRFLHADFVSFVSGTGDGAFKLTGDAVIGITAQTPFSSSTEELEHLKRMYGAIRAPLTRYGIAKSMESAIRYLDWRARKDVDSMLEITYARAGRSRFPHLIAAAKDIWSLRGTRVLGRELVAGLWLALMSTETIKSNWTSEHSRLKQDLAESGMFKLADAFDVGYKTVKEQDVSMIRDAVQEIATRSEGRNLFAATIGGALAAIIGGGISAAISAGLN